MKHDNNVVLKAANRLELLYEKSKGRGGDKEILTKLEQDLRAALSKSEHNLSELVGP